MNAIASSLAFAAALAAAPALAHESHPLPPLAPPAAFVAVEAQLPLAPPPAPAYRPFEQDRTWGHYGQMRSLRAEYRRLEMERERFYAGWRGNPGAQRRFERWYASRRAQLDRRYAWLSERGERHGRYAWNDREYEREHDHR
ncbi:MAG: hypothetical protein HZB56_14370 [Deltaproteobacteria bacterium]|nr:hypothetical protein [Deltaproteobacteria bacterium]